MTHIVVDAMGGDNAPQAVVEGCLKAINDFDIKITLVGKEDLIRGYLVDYDSDKISIVNADEVINNIVDKNSNTYGFDALNDNYVDMLEAGIVDPVKVTKSALLNATSIASMLLTTEAAIVKVPEQQPMVMPPMMG